MGDHYRLLVLMSAAILCAVLPLTACQGAEVPLRVLVLVPFPDSKGGWDRGLELLPAARVAVKEINNDKYTLSGYRLELVERASDACGRSIIVKGLSNLVNHAFSNNNNTMAVIGLACSTVTASVSPIAGREEVSLLQLAMANSNIFRTNIDSYPHLWRFLATSDHLVLTLEEFAKYVQWTRFGLVFDGEGFFFNAIAATFRNIIEQKGGTLLVDQGIVSISEDISATLDLIQSFGVRVIFSPTTIPESVELMCQAAKRNLVWPGYVWVFPSRSYSEFFGNSTECDEPELLKKALENVLLIQSDITNTNDSSVLLTGRTYGEFRAEYEKEREQLEQEEAFSEALKYFTFDPDYNIYANLMYNEVWALGLALNASLPELNDRGFDLSKYEYNQSSITAIIEKNLKNISFQGTVGRVQFDKYREVGTNVRITQVRNKAETIIGFYEDASFRLFNISMSDIPADTFESQYKLLNTGLASVIYLQACILGIFITVMLSLLILLRKEPEVRASSPLLTIHIFVGCYFLLLASVLLTTRQYARMSNIAYQIVCYIGDLFGYIGLNLISASVLLRMIRVYRIFTKVTKINWAWKNKPLFIFTILIATIPVLFTLIEIAVVPKRYSQNIKLILDVNPPVQEISIHCSSKYANIFESIIIAYVMSVILALLAFAVLTRNIDKKHFNDTKKVMAFVFVFTILGTVFIAVSYILRSFNNDNDSVVVQSYMNHLMILVSQIFLIVPKVIPTFYYRYFKKEERNVHEEQQDNDWTVTKAIFSPFAKKFQPRSVTTNTSTSQPVFF